MCTGNFPSTKRLGGEESYNLIPNKNSVCLKITPNTIELCASENYSGHGLIELCPRVTPTTISSITCADGFKLIYFNKCTE